MIKTEVSDQYLELLKKSLLNELYIENEVRLLYTFLSMMNSWPLEFNQFFNVVHFHPNLMNTVRDSKMSGHSVVLFRQAADGGSSPAHDLRNVTELSHTMIGRRRLENLQYCIETVLEDGVSGDFIETGIWRGGACIFMRGVLMAYGVTDRIVWAADSFEGVPPPTRPEDAGFDISRNVLPVLAVTLDEVEELFRRYGLLDQNVKFLKGWFKDTLPAAPIERLSILRLDGDLYESTMDALNPLYDKVESGGFVIVDDYNSCPPCKHAVDIFRNQRGISASLTAIDAHGVFWRKS